MYATARQQAKVRLLVLGAVGLQDRRGRDVIAVLAQPRRLALLAYLALAPAGAFQHRAALAGLFWPEADDAHARGALAQALWFLRRALGAGALPGRGDGEVRLDAAACSCDVAAFEAAVASADVDAAVALYRGDLMEGIFIDAAPAFDVWLEGRRGRLARAYAGALEQVAGRRGAAGDHAAALECWRTLAARAPESGHAVAGLMRALAAADDRAGALHAAAAHAALLRRELGAAPDVTVAALADRLRGEAGPGDTGAGPAVPPARLAPPRRPQRTAA
jgi:serine/threonine-protein kinase